MATSRAKIDSNLKRIREEVVAACARRGRREADVSIVAVTKSVGIEAISLLPALGLTDLAESRVQQLVDRAAALAARLGPPPAGQRPVRWHMVGHLQRNKVRQVLEVADVIHSIDSLRLAEELDQRAEKLERVVDVMIEVNCSEEPQKTGLAVGATAHMAGLVATMRHLRLIGLMTMAPRVRNMENARPTFVRLRELFEDIRRDGAAGEAFRHLSMGMSQDYPVAVEEGATMLRIGTALFE
jgi:PLP dependent protein